MIYDFLYFNYHTYVIMKNDKTAKIELIEIVFAESQLSQDKPVPKV